MNKGDKPTTIIPSLKLVNTFIHNQNAFIVKHWLSLQSFELFMLIVNYYNDTGGKGLSCSMMLRYSTYSIRYYKKIYSMLTTLHNQGLVEFIGIGVNNCKLFAPTDKGIKCINDMLANIDI